MNSIMVRIMDSPPHNQAGAEGPNDEDDAVDWIKWTGCVTVILTWNVLVFVCTLSQPPDFLTQNKRYNLWLPQGDSEEILRRLYMKSDFKDIVQLKPNLMSSPTEIHHNSGYMKALKTGLSRTKCSPIMPDQFLSPKSSVKMSEEATMCTYPFVDLLSQPQISKSGN
jgi:hypothetical protein